LSLLGFEPGGLSARMPLPLLPPLMLLPLVMSLPLPLPLLPLLMPLLLLMALPLFMSPLVPVELHAARLSAARPLITTPCITFITPPLPEKSG
jgi:hypothetical protein